MPVDIVASDEVIQGNLIAAAIFEDRTPPKGPSVYSNSTALISAR